MKCLLIVDSIKDETLYSEYDSETLGVNIKTIIYFLKENIGEKPHYFQAGKHKFVLQYNEHLWYILVSDDEDSEALLRTRLYLLNTLFTLVLGDLMVEKSLRSFKVREMSRLKKKMSEISGTVNAMFDESQSVLAQAYEYLEVNDGIRKKSVSALKKLLYEDLPDSSHALIFVGTKLLAYLFKHKPHLQYFDLFLLSIYTQIQLYPRAIKKQSRPDLDQNLESPISEEISTFENISNNNVSTTPNNNHFDEMSAEEDNYETAPEDFDEPLTYLSSPFLDKILKDSSFDGSDSTTTTTTTNATTRTTTTTTTPSFSTSASSSSTIGSNNLGGISESPSTSSTSSSPPETPLLFKRNRHNTLTNSLKEGLKSSSVGDAVALLNYSLHFIGYLDQIPPNARDIYTSVTEAAVKKFQEDNSLDATGTADFQTIRLILTKVKTSNDEPKNMEAELEKLEKHKNTIRDIICKPFLSFLLTKEASNIAISGFSHIPGLVHFIFIDRTLHRVRAPSISPLFGREFPNQPNHSDMINFLKKKIWTILWIEDDEGAEQPLDLPIGSTNRSMVRYNSKNFYADLLKHYFPHSAKMKCYELLTLYIGILPVSLVSKNDKTLYCLLFEKDDQQ
eukprot:gene5405-6742_t